MPAPRVTVDDLPDKAVPEDTDRLVIQDTGVMKRTDLGNVRALVGVLAGVGDPEGVLTAAVGTLFLRSDGGADTTLYVKESGVGNTGWVAK